MEQNRLNIPIYDISTAIGAVEKQRLRVSASDLQTAASKYGVSWAVVEFSDGKQSDYHLTNRWLLSALKDNSRFLPLPIINLTADSPSVTVDLNRERADIRAFRLMPLHHGYPFEPWLLQEWADALESLNASLWLPADEMNADSLYRSAEAFPAIHFVLTGVKGSHISLLNALLRQLSNVWIDTGLLDSEGVLEKLVETHGSQRLLFGSGLPFTDPIAFIDYMMMCDIPEEALMDILYRNAWTLLGQPPEPIDIPAEQESNL